MFAFTVDLLTGRFVAKAYNDHNRPEWPPHPARLFSALVATWAEGDPASPEGIMESHALRWLEEQGAPEILASGEHSIAVRTVMSVFVPVNDASIVSAPDRAPLDEAETAVAEATDDKMRIKAEKDLVKQRKKFEENTAKAIATSLKIGKETVSSALRVLPDFRGKQPRTFPSITPESSTFAFCWPEVTLSDDVREALQRLASRLVRIGHSSTLVSAAIKEGPLAALRARTEIFVPDSVSGSKTIRWVTPGQFDVLLEAFERHQETEPRVLPAKFVRYREGTETISESAKQTCFDSEFIVFRRLSGPRLPMVSTVGLAKQFRRALMSHADQPIDEIISGHKPEGAPAETPHVAVVPLPVVSGPYPDGALLRIAVVLPRNCNEASRRAVMRAVARMEQTSGIDGNDALSVEINLGEAGRLMVQRKEWGEEARNREWVKASTHWASATPIALDKNPGNLHDENVVRRQKAFEEATEIVAAAVANIGLPRPRSIDVVRSCVLPGSTKPRNFPRYPIDPRRNQRVLVHVRLVFDQVIQGPILLGAGRYDGLGLCLPIFPDRNKGSKQQ
jgi:CRISPR-associated protein Csb2